MKINRNNYEIFFLDYLEGKLNAAEVAELLLFVDNHPDLQQELELMGGEVPQIPFSEDAVFGEKLSLKKSEAGEMSRIDELFAKKLEGDLTTEEAAELDREMELNPSLAKQWELFSLTKISAEGEVSFSQKSSIRQHELSELDLKMAAAAEGDLSEQEHSVLQTELQKENRESELTLMTASKLAPDTSVRFFNKASLKKKVPVVGLFWRSAAAVAAVALFGFFLSPVLFNQSVNTGSFAEREGVSSIERDVNSGFENAGETESNPVAEKSQDNSSDQSQRGEVELADFSEKEQMDDAREEGQLANLSEQEQTGNSQDEQEIESENGLNREDLQKIDRQKLKLTDAKIALADIATPSESQIKSVDSKAVKSDQKNEEFMTLASLATKKAEQVSGLNLGSENIKGELMQKAVNLINGQSNEVVKIEVGDEPNGDATKGWMFKIGKVEVSRKKAM